MKPPRSYSSPEVCKATRATYRQLDYWERTGLVTPSIREASGSGSQRRYSEEDLERVLAIVKLLGAGFSLQAVRRFLGDGEALTDALRVLRTVRAWLAAEPDENDALAAV